MKTLIILTLFGVALFCAFGFAATFEPLNRAQQIRWRVLYGAGALLSLAGVGWVMANGRRRDR